MPWFRRIAKSALLGCVLLTGCSLVGSWCTVEVEPEGALFPVAAVTFADDRTYCASHSAGGQTHATCGTYTWTGLKLMLRPQGDPAQTFSGHFRFDGKLALTQKTDARQITAVLEKQPDEKTAPPP